MTEIEEAAGELQEKDLLEVETPQVAAWVDGWGRLVDVGELARPEALHVAAGNDHLQPLRRKQHRYRRPHQRGDRRSLRWLALTRVCY